MILIALTVLAFASPSSNQVLAADPASWDRVLATARAGDTIRLAAGHYPVTTVRTRTFDPPLTIDATAATLSGVMIINSSGVTWNGGTLAGDPGNPAGFNYGFLAVTSRNVVVARTHITGFRVGIVFDRVTDGALTGNWLSRMTADGADIAASRGINVADNTCSDFMPGQGAHPDCIQLWSRPDLPPTADVTITDNHIIGAMQGISLFNPTAGGVDAGGFDRIDIVGNSILNTYASGITLDECRSCILKNNSVNSLPNYINKAQLNVWGGSVEQCGNVVTLVPRQSTPPCAGGG